MSDAKQRKTLQQGASSAHEPGESRMKAGRCQMTAASGKPCSATPRPGRPFCLWHDPEAAELRREISRKGGQGRSTKTRATKALGIALTPPEIARVLSQALVDLPNGVVERGVATAMVNVAGVLIDIYKEWSVSYITDPKHIADQEDVADQAAIGRDAERAAAQLGITARELFELGVVTAVADRTRKGA